MLASDRIGARVARSAADRAADPEVPMFRSFPATEVHDLIPVPASCVGGADYDEHADADRMIPTWITTTVPAAIVGTRSITAPTTPFRGLDTPVSHVRVLARRERADRAALRAERAGKRPLVKFGPVIVGHDGSNAFERAIRVTAARIVADANARRFGPTWFRA